MKKDYMRTLDGAWELASGSDWEATDFSLRKAALCAAFSRLVYSLVTEKERAAQDRYMVVPCIDYQEIVLGNARVDVMELLRQAEFGGQHFTVITDSAVVLGIVQPKFIVIAIRGTQTFFDWAYNLDIIPVNTQTPDAVPVTLHKGFHDATRDFIGPITRALLKLGDPPTVPIYVTGHSLGGAMAALFHMLWYLQNRDRGIYCATRSCYTFGMPRFGNGSAVNHSRMPFHIYNPPDIVPRTPPSLGIYEDPRLEFHADGSRFDRIRDERQVSVFQLIAEHSMQRYQELIRVHV